MRGDEERVPELPQKVDAHVHSADQPNSTSQKLQGQSLGKRGAGCSHTLDHTLRAGRIVGAADATVHTISGPEDVTPRDRSQPISGEAPGFGANCRPVDPMPQQKL